MAQQRRFAFELRRYQTCSCGKDFRLIALMDGTSVAWNNRRTRSPPS
jgi:hypothetical protein